MSLFLCKYFEYTSYKEIRFNSITELCAEYTNGQNHIGMKHCPRDGEPVPPTIVWEFRDVSVASHTTTFTYATLTCFCTGPELLFCLLQDGSIYHPLSDKCITAYRTAEGRTDVQMQKCSSEDMNQNWKFEWLWFWQYVKFKLCILYEVQASKL